MDSVKKLSRTGNVIRIILLITNALVMLFGLVLIGVGAAALANQFTILTSVTLASGIIVVGVLLLLIAFLGCWGALKENRKLLIAFFAFVLFFVVVQFGIGIAAYVMKDDIPLWADQAWGYLYSVDPSTIDTAENTFKCCGYTTTIDRAVPDRALPPMATEQTCALNWYKDLGTCSTKINSDILLVNDINATQAIALAATIQTSEQCCGWTSVTDASPWGFIDTDGTPCPSDVWTTSCFSQLNTTWSAAYASASAAGDNYIIAYENKFKCCGYGGATIYQVPKYYNNTCVMTKNYTQPCQQIMTDAVIQSLGAIGGVCIAIAILELFMLAITIYMIRNVPRNRKDDLDMPPAQEMIDEE